MTTITTARPASAAVEFSLHSWHLTLRALRTLSRQPMYLAFNLVQPMVWLLLFGQLFTRLADLPGFGSNSYLEYLTPGVVVMTAVFSPAGPGRHSSRTWIAGSWTATSRHRSIAGP